MSVKKDRPTEVRKSDTVGPNYPEDRHRIPWGAGFDSNVGDEDSKEIWSPNGTTFDTGIPIDDDYASWWGGGKK